MAERKQIRPVPSGTSLFRAGAAVSFMFLVSPLAVRPQTSATTIGRLEGDDVAAKGSISVIVENGRNTTILGSGSDVTVRSGQARILLAEGGEIDICAPAHFSLLKSNGSITLAMDSGRLHVVLENAIPLAVYTPLMVATPEAIGGAPREVSAGVELSGTICVWAVRGAIRLDEQLTGQSLVVPQGGEMALPNGQLAAIQNASGKCRCEWLAVKTAPASTAKSAEYSVPARTSPEPPRVTAPKVPEPKPAPSNLEAPRAAPATADKNAAVPPTETPTWKVVMPPLVFDASSPASPPEPSPETILLIREARVVPEVVFSGRVESTNRSPGKSQTTATKPDEANKKHQSFFAKLFRALFGHRS